MVTEEQELLLRRIVRHQGWAEVSAALGLAGREAGISALRRLVRRLVDHYGDQTLMAEAKRLDALCRG